MSTALEELKLFVDRAIVPDDVIMGILSGLSDNSISKDPGVFHQAIYDLKKKSDYSELLKEFNFDTSGLTPYSDLLDRVLFRLETANILGTLNPRYAMYELQKEQLKQRFEKFPSNKKTLLRQMSKDFTSLINS